MILKGPTPDNLWYQVYRRVLYATDSGSRICALPRTSGTCTGDPKNNARDLPIVVTPLSSSDTMAS